MTTGFVPVTPQKVQPEQVLAWFGVFPDENHKILCPFKEETIPSMQVNKDFCYCYGCGISLDTLELADIFFQKKGTPKTLNEIYKWLSETTFEKTKLTYKKSKYKGPVNAKLIDYWHNYLYSFGKEDQLKRERLLTSETIKAFKLGYRPDHNAWVIPYLRPNGEADIVQFRSMEEGKRDKYYGLAGHNRGSIMNWKLLETVQPYLVVLMGAFDGILAQQDGLPAISINGSMPFAKADKDRIQQIFSKQKCIFIVPDNTQTEFSAAKKLAEWVSGEVRYFPENLPEGTDYIDFRKLGYTIKDFEQLVLQTKPIVSVAPQLIDNLTSLYRCSDPFDLSNFHLEWYGRGISCKDIALSLSLAIPSEKHRLYNVKNLNDLIKIIKNPSRSW